jgi:hypothetical protein
MIIINYSVAFLFWTSSKNNSNMGSGSGYMGQEEYKKSYL